MNVLYRKHILRDYWIATNFYKNELGTTVNIKDWYIIAEIRFTTKFSACNKSICALFAKVAAAQLSEIGGQLAHKQ